MNEIRKPLSLLRAEFINSLTDLINNAGLPPFIIEPILKDRYNDMKAMSQKQLEYEVKEYQDKVKQQNMDNSSSGDSCENNGESHI